MSDALVPRELGPCPVCGQTLSRPINSCSSCHTPHHADCWEYNQGCSIFGCGAKPPPPPTTHPGARAVLARLAFIGTFLMLFGMFELGGHALSVRVDDLAVDTVAHNTVANWMTTPRSRCMIEVVRADEPDVVLFRKHTPRCHHHRVELPFIKPGQTYLVRVTSQSGIFSGETMSQLFRSPEEPAPSPVLAAMTPPPAPFAPLPFPMPPYPMSPHGGPPPFAHAFHHWPAPPPPPLPLGLAEMAPRDPFRMPSNSIRLHVRPEDRHAPFSNFDLRIQSHDGQVTWRTRTPLMFCRVLVMRDSTLKGVDRVVDASSRNGVFHRVNLEGLDPDTNYHLLVLGFPESGDPLQSPVLAFRTLP